MPLATDDATTLSVPGSITYPIAAKSPPPAPPPEAPEPVAASPRGRAAGRPILSHLTPLLAAALADAAEAEADAEAEAAADAPAAQAATPGTSLEFGDLLLRDALRERASDIHLEPFAGGWRVRLRVDGTLYDAAVIGRAAGQRLVRHMKAISGLDPVAAPRPQDGRRTYKIDGREVDLRLALAPCLAGEKLVVRLLDPATVGRDVQRLGMGESGLARVREWLGHVHGMVMVVGPTGSGKTTTLYALLGELAGRDRAITTIEDPVEYQLDGVAQMQVNARAGVTFAEAVRAMARLDSDVLLVGELRGPEEARAAVEAAARGRVLLTTLHCRDAVAAVRMLRRWGTSEHEVAGSVDLVIAQRLVRKLCPDCRRQDLPGDADRRWFESLGIPLPDRTWEPSPDGCPACHRTGYRGRSGVFEVWRLGEQDYRLLLDGADEMELRRDLLARGHRTLLDDGLAKAKLGVTSLAELQVMAESYAPRLTSAAGWGQARAADGRDAGATSA